MRDQETVKTKVKLKKTECDIRSKRSTVGRTVLLEQTGPLSL